MLTPQEDVFTRDEILNTIQQVSTFDHDYLDFYNFLECIIRVAKAKLWTAEEEKAHETFDLKVNEICERLYSTYHGEVTQEFNNVREGFEQDRKYQPRLVVDDDEGESDEDDMHWLNANETKDKTDCHLTMIEIKFF